jgi:hypothetical protein
MQRQTDKCFPESNQQACRSCPTVNSCLRLSRLTARMLEIADHGNQCRQDLSCGGQYAVVRDTAFRLRELVKLESEDQRPIDGWD